jgi:CRP/FNR family transcriptional regulator, cyclic AMP receptor protein
MKEASMKHAPLSRDVLTAPMLSLRGDLAARKIPTELAEQVSDHLHLIHYKKGDLVFGRGAPGDLLFWVLSGLVKVYFPRTDGTRSLMQIVGPGEFIGHDASVDQRGRRIQAFEAQALTNSAIGAITRAQVLQMLGCLDRAVLVEIIETLNEMRSTKKEWFSDFLGMSLRKRLETVLLDLAQKFGAREANAILLIPQLRHDDLAEMIGSSRPMVSRLIADMIEEGLIAKRGQQFVLKSGLAAAPPFSAPSTKEVRHS